MVKVKYTKDLELDTLEAGSLVAQVLQEDYEFLCKEINELRGKALIGIIKSYEAEDLSNDLEIREAMKTLMRYYMTRNDYNEFMELQRVYGNV
jgi:hypothetical protein